MHLFVQLSLWCVLQNQEDPFGIVEEAVELENVLMPQMALDLDLSLQLMGNLRPDKLIFLHHLDCNNEARLLLTSKVHVTKLAPT